MLDLAESARLMRLLAEPTRLRLLLLLQHESLTVAELTAITQLAQSRVSSHLARLRDAELVLDEARGNTNLYAVDPARWPPGIEPFWRLVKNQIDDAQLTRDREQAAKLVAARSRSRGWAASVAGRMERHYSPGRTWEALSRILAERLAFGAVLDIASGDGVFAELIAHRAERMTCIDASEAVIDAARQRLDSYPQVKLVVGDMHALPFSHACFDDVFLLHALTYSADPATAVREAARVLRPGGRLTLATIARHDNSATVTAYDHVNLGFDGDELWALLTDDAGLDVLSCGERTQEARPPYFRLLTASAVKPKQ